MDIKLKGVDYTVTMSCLERQHVSRKASVQHPCNLDTFMDETDREVMNLTDRAFKSLCIGDEAIYNDSELCPSPVDCHKPLAEEIPKKPRENSTTDIKKHGAHRPNGVYDTLWQINKNASKVSSLFAAFAAKQNNDTKIMNGDSWDKSALLSIQTELSGFSSDLQNHLVDEQVESKTLEKQTANKSIQDVYNSSGKSSKNQHSKSTKLRKLNSKNFFLHSEFSPFQSWGDLNRFGLENVEMFPCNSPAGLYDFPLYGNLNDLNRLHVPEPNKRVTSQSTSPREPWHKSKPNLSQCTAQTVPLVPEQQSERNIPKLPNIQIQALQPQVLLTKSESFQRCQSEGDLYAPWRKSRSRTKGVAIISSACERTNMTDQVAMQNKMVVKTVEEKTCLNSTPFSISQLLTPVIPSRQGTGTSEILQSVHSPTVFDVSALPEIHPSPDIKREGYKSKASSLLFNLKDNRKRVKAIYSPPKFKGSDAADQNEPPIKQDVTNNVRERPEIADSKTTPTVQKPCMYPMSPETADVQSSQASALPFDDFLGLSLLQAKNQKSKKNPLAKATYPSLNLYRKSSPVELNTKTMSMDVSDPCSTQNKHTEQKISKEYVPERNSKDLQRKRYLTKPKIINANHEYTHLSHVENADRVMTEKTDAVALKEKYIQDVRTCSGSRIQDILNTGGTSKEEESNIKFNEFHRNETKPKHLFSTRQNNYIKTQRYVNVDNNNDDVDDECEYWQENVISAGKDESRKMDLNVDVHKDTRKVQGNVDDLLVTESFTSDAFPPNNHSIPSKNDLGICTEQGVGKNRASMKGNTLAKVALFTLKEQPLNTGSGSNKKNIVKGKYELATVALEKKIAESEQRKKLSDRQSGQDLALRRDHNRERMQASNPKESVIQDRGGQKAISDITPTSQNVQSMSDINTSHGECHVPEVKLPKPCKQEGAAKHNPSSLIYRDRPNRHVQESDTGNIKSMANVAELKETVFKNIRLDQDSSVAHDNIDNKNVRVEDESDIQKKEDWFKPDTHARREKNANSQRRHRVMNERQKKDDVTFVESFIKQEECLMFTEIKPSNLLNDKGPVKGHVLSLTEKFNREREVPSLNAQECLSQGDGLMVHPENDSLKQKVISPKHIMGLPEVEEILTKRNHTAREAGSDIKEKPDKDSKVAMPSKENVDREIADKQGNLLVYKDETRKEEDVSRTKNKNALEDLRKIGIKNEPQYLSESFVKESLTDHFVKPNEPDDESKTTPSLSMLNPDNAPMHKITLYGSPNQAERSSLVDVTQLVQGNEPSKLSEDSSFLHKSEESSSLNKGEERTFEKLDTIDSCFTSNAESKLHDTDRTVSLPKDVEKGGWVHSLMDSARNLTPACQSNASSPTPGKPALFKMKDNTFSASPVTKTVRPVLHKTVAGVTQPWSPRESLSGSERGEEDPDIFKKSVHVQSPALSSTPVQMSQPNQSSLQVVSPPPSQSATDQERKWLMDTSTVAEEDEWQPAISSFSESCETSAGDIAEELAFTTAPTDSIEGSKAPSERSGSVCSGVENQFQGKPPAVPPKTEKALRRAMKLTTKRIQKAEAKSKSERGRSSEKGSCERRERRHHSSDKVFNDRSCQRERNIDRDTVENDSETSLSKSHTAERLGTLHSKPNSRRKEKDAERRLQHSNLISMDNDAKGCVAERQKENQSRHKDRSDSQNVNANGERLGRTSEKNLPHKLYRRAHSLDRFSSGIHEHRVFSSEDPISKTSSETLPKLAAAKTAPSRQNSTEHAYGSPSNNPAPQSFPMTQRKLLQDLDSGQYFVVDMPVQVQTKTFFDPETGSYVQLPVQSLERSVPRAQSVEVVSAPPLMLYHGFVPVPVSSLP